MAGHFFHLDFLFSPGTAIMEDDAKMMGPSDNVYKKKEGVFQMNKILIAEDEAPIANLIRTVLTDAGYRCVWASDGTQAAEGSSLAAVRQSCQRVRTAPIITFISPPVSVYRSLA